MSSTAPAASPRLARLLWLGVCLEGGLAVVGWGLAWWWGVDWRRPHGPWPERAPSLLWSLFCGALFAIPMLAALWGVWRCRLPAVVRWRRRLIRRVLRPLLGGCTWGQAAALSAAAGLGEEFLFRGVIQNAVAQSWPGGGGVAAGLLTASLLFGAAHWISPGYAAFAAIVGLYLGLVFLWSGDLAAPIMAHALYDLVALRTLLRRPASSGVGAAVAGPNPS